MKRRHFLKNISVAAGAPFMLNGIPVGLFANNNALQALAATATNDKVLVVIQLHGGNDGLNMVIPVSQYSSYYNIRPNIAIPDFGSRKFIKLDNTLAEAKQVGLHPDMVGLKSLYDEGKLNIVQGVSYQNNNGSHFRGRDIWFMGGGYNDYSSSGWMGRFLDEQYPGYPDGPPIAYPNTDMPDPLGLEIGEGVSLAFQRSNGIPAGLAVDSPEAFYQLINSVGGDLAINAPNSFYGDELKYIIGIENQSNGYAARLRDVFNKGKNTAGVVYPETYPFNAPTGSLRNGLSGQLKLVARLLSGGIKTKIFLVRIGGFDTHASQVESYDPTMGGHAALLYHISSAVKAFMDDLKGLGVDDRVIGMTMSEFGRRAKSNISYGTDHGTAAPTLLFGKSIKPGVTGNNVDLGSLRNDNIPMQYDYRQILATLLDDWLGGKSSTLQAAGFEPYTPDKLDIIATASAITGLDDFLNERFRLNNCFPNPASTSTTFSFYINNTAQVAINIFDMKGGLVANVINEQRDAGLNEVAFDVSNLKTGSYIYKIESMNLKGSKQLIILR